MVTIKLYYYYNVCMYVSMHISEIMYMQIKCSPIYINSIMYEQFPITSITFYCLL